MKFTIDYMRTTYYKQEFEVSKEQIEKVLTPENLEWFGRSKEEILSNPELLIDIIKESELVELSYDKKHMIDYDSEELNTELIEE
jgi:hypothetical protein